MLQIYKRYVLLLPVMVVALGELGRGVFNSLLFLYFVSSLGLFISLSASTRHSAAIRQHTGLLLIWVSIFGFSMLTTLFNGAFSVGYQQWLVALLSSSVLFFVMYFYDDVEDVAGSNVLLFLLLFVFSFFVVRLFNCVLDTSCIPALSVPEMSIAMLAPLILLYLVKFGEISFLYLTLVFTGLLFLLVLGDSRTEILMLAAAYFTMLAFHRRRLAWLVAIPVTLLVVVVGFLLFVPREDFSELSGWYQQFDLLTSYRLTIWSNAINNPPASMLLGAGVDNTMAFLPANDFRSALHNAFLEIWYETGFIGLFLWLGLIALALKDVGRVYRKASGQQRLVYTAFLGSFVALLVAGTLDKGYMSSYFRFYFFYLVAVLAVLGSDMKRRGGK